MEPTPTEITNRTSRLHLDAHGIVWVEFLPGAEQKLADAHANVADSATLLNNTKGPILVDMRGVKSMDRDARVYYSGEETARISSAIAIIVGSPISRLVGNFAMTAFHDRTKLVPCKLFSNEADAVAWLLAVTAAPPA